MAGVGADGWPGLSPLARDAIEHAEVVIGGARHLALLPASVTGRRVELPSPLLPSLPGLIAEHAGSALVVLASGDPMFYGIGTDARPAARPGAAARAAAPVVGVAGRRAARLADQRRRRGEPGRAPAAELLHPLLQPGRRVLALSPPGDGRRGRPRDC